MGERLVRIVRGYLKYLVPLRWRPGPYLRSKAFEQTQYVVRTGPFHGMQYIDRAHCSAHLPKILGLYEKELHPQVEYACKLACDRFVDIGAAEGYYAVGFATRRADVPVVAFELDPNARNMLVELIRLNGVEGRVDVRGRCDIPELAELVREGVALVICDCEGGEVELLDPLLVPGLTRAYLLVEVHEFVAPGVTTQLEQRFKETHNVTIIRQQERRRTDFPFSDWYIRTMQEADLVGVISEDRPIVMQWLWMIPLV